MQDHVNAFGEAIRLIGTLDEGLVEIVALSLRVSLLAVAVAALVGALPLGRGGRGDAFFPGRAGPRSPS